eukprot:CAMPEP_0175895188 /NCGR_PEP_ID=MMETSP0107_2-20121207/50384_1 /TAXON_ID=195067 ORGANISM="Goniomonas pacifica, Strain CCMP1869" /NCGR_SAMPLE_ID=MMETSP0107_2 /ASSEMBLY_ACC=CAM_ASM_000203 /LENGTH=73 /DNA_ID=CAMNT_0017216315 /DNA_START=201 /DNA_END=418 /DNA_ORIENTATION=-
MSEEKPHNGVQRELLGPCALHLQHFVCSAIVRHREAWGRRLDVERKLPLLRDELENSRLTITLKNISELRRIA